MGPAARRNPKPRRRRFCCGKNFGAARVLAGGVSAKNFGGRHEGADRAASGLDLDDGYSM